MIGNYILKRKQDFENAEIKIADGANQTFNQRENVRRINLYINDKYLDREDGIFWNLSTTRVPQFAKLLELDTKDLQPYGIGEVNFFQAWILRMKFYRWLQDNQFAVTLNELAEGLAIYGSTVWKKYEDEGIVELEEVNLENLLFDPKAECISDSDVIEIHHLSSNELYGKKDVWENVDKVLKLEKDKSEIEVWEWHGFVPVSEGSTDREYKHIIGHGWGDKYTELFSEDADPEEPKYFDFHLGRYKGRWQRIGVVERLYKLQERVNQLVNQNAQTSEIASLLLLRSADPNMAGNVLQSIESGQIIPSADLTQIPIQNPGIANFMNELQMIERQADRLCMTPEVITGESLPSGTPFRSMATLGNAAKSAFKPYRETVGEEIGYILKEHIFPEITKEWKKEDLFDIGTDENDIKIYDELLKRRSKRDYFIENLLSGNVVPENDVQAFGNSVVENQVRDRKINIPKNYFNFDFGIRTNITGEEVDKQQKNDAAYNALVMSSQNPAIVNTPLFKQYLEDNGINYWKLTPEQINQLSMGAMAGQNVQMPGKTDELMSQVNPV